jgi:hypothetical protein
MRRAIMPKAKVPLAELKKLFLTHSRNSGSVHAVGRRFFLIKPVGRGGVISVHGAFETMGLVKGL